jgi:hypothetical protein
MDCIHKRGGSFLLLRSLALKCLSVEGMRKLAKSVGNAVPGELANEIRDKHEGFRNTVV